MNPLYEARSALRLYCSNVVVLLEKALEDYCNASMKQEKETIFMDVKKYSLSLVLLEPFYCLNGEKKNAAQLQKLCTLLGHENYQENNKEQIHLLTKILQLIAQLPVAVCR